MPKVRASLADVSTEFKPAEPGTYTLKIEDVKDVSQGPNEAYNVIVSIQDPGDEYGKKIFDRCGFVTRDGSPNNAGLAQFKRYFEAVLGKEEVALPEFEYDTDAIIGQMIQGEVTIESWEKGEPGSPEYKSGKSNRIKNMVKAQ